jgi:SpoVK/Ycf46/Vps4 family AAA+-type ATPase
MWFGESEKKIKEIFTQYRALLNCSKRTPILLFNEADGVFGTRMELKDSNTSQTFNTMQNILLEELENFEGILMATTNLTSNFDRAFERRFLYKIEFSSPCEEIRSKIWRSKIQGLSQKVSLELSRNFNLSGGQIENVTRRFHINSILYGSDLSFESLSAYCREELLTQATHNTVGFKQTRISKAS